jgi:hypothetical protein
MNGDKEDREDFSRQNLRLWQWTRPMMIVVMHLNLGVNGEQQMLLLE